MEKDRDSSSPSRCGGSNHSESHHTVTESSSSVKSSSAVSKSSLAGSVNQMDHASCFHMEDTLRSRQFEGINVCFRDLSVHIHSGSKKKYILYPSSGYMSRGTLTAVMGPSGSGKTTLVDMITKRKNTGIRAGKVLYDGKEPSKEFLRHGVSYVQQDEALIENLTVRETFQYYYDLVAQAPSTVASQGCDTNNRNNVLHGIIQQLSLGQCADVQIGNAFQRGISGGQRKRVNIGISLLEHPRLLIMDEPTSGLDSFHSVELMTTVHRLCDQGLTTVATIHSPSPSIFSLFEELIVLLDGRLVYCGNATLQSVEYFTSHGFQKKSMDQTDADWLDEIVVQTSRLGRSDELALIYMKSALRHNNDAKIDALSPLLDTKFSQKGLSHGKASWLHRSGLWATWCIIKHRLSPDYRMPGYLLPRIFQAIFMTILMCTVFLNVARTSETTDEVESLEDDLARPLQTMTALSLWVSIPLFGCTSVIPSVFHEKPIFLRDKKSGCYNAGSYLSAKMFQETLRDVFLYLISACCVWFALGLSGSWLLFWLTFFINLFIGTVMAYFLAFISPNTETAILLCSAINVIFLCFAGVLIRQNDIPVYWKWVFYINHMHYAWAALMKNQFSGEDYLGPYGIRVFSYFGLDNSLTGWDYVGILVAFACLYFLLAYLSLRYINYGRR